MIPTQMSNEQFALYIASLKYSSANDVTKIAEAYYKWLESNRKKPIPPFSNAETKLK
jgi:hypothetical protein